MRRSRKPVRVFRSDEGSNPSLSATHQKCVVCRALSLLWSRESLARTSGCAGLMDRDFPTHSIKVAAVLGALSDERMSDIRPDPHLGRPASSAIRGRSTGSATKSSGDWSWAGSSTDPDRCCDQGASLRAARGEPPLTTVPAGYTGRRSGGSLSRYSGWLAKPATRARILGIATTL